MHLPSGAQAAAQMSLVCIAVRLSVAARRVVARVEPSLLSRCRRHVRSLVSRVARWWWLSCCSIFNDCATAVWRFLLMKVVVFVIVLVVEVVVVTWTH